MLYLRKAEYISSVLQQMVAGFNETSGGPCNSFQPIKNNLNFKNN